MNIRFVSMFEWHPFSVSAVEDDVLTFHIKANGVGSWTRNLFSSVVSSDYPSKILVALDGPYGCMNINPTSYSRIIIIAGGIGITPFLPVIRSQMQLPEKQIHLIWSMRDKELLSIIFNDTCLGLKSSSSLKVKVHLTANSPQSLNSYFNIMPDATSGSSVCDFDASSAERVTLMCGRPNLSVTIADLVASLSPTEAKSTCILVCGPSNMSNEVVRSAVLFGIDYHRETFEL